MACQEIALSEACKARLSQQSILYTWLHTCVLHLIGMAVRFHGTIHVPSGIADADCACEEKR